MYEKTKSRMRELLVSGEVQGILALRQNGAHVAPYLFLQPDGLDELAIGDTSSPGAARYPLMKILQELLHSYPEARFGVLARGCDERALKTLITWNQISSERVVLIGLACPQTLAEACACLRPFPEEWVEGEPAQPLADHRLLLEETSQSMGWLSWLRQFEKCVKCYGCRNICPMCYCDECALESEDVVAPGNIPPEFPMFHLVRAIHMIGRCVDCGLCEQACPAEIPLRLLYKKVNAILFEHFQFRAGFDTNVKSPLHKAVEPPPTR